MAETVAATPDEQLLDTIAKVWGDHQMTMMMVRDILMYMVRAVPPVAGACRWKAHGGPCHACSGSHVRDAEQKDPCLRQRSHHFSRHDRAPRSGEFVLAQLPDCPGTHAIPVPAWPGSLIALGRSCSGAAPAQQRTHFQGEGPPAASALGEHPKGTGWATHRANANEEHSEHACGAWCRRAFGDSAPLCTGK